MSNVSDNPFLRGSQRLYGWSLAAYPKRHRKEYGPAMQQVFRDQCLDAWRAARGWGLAMLWLRVLPDLFKTAFVERLLTIKGDSVSHRFARILGFHSNPRVLFLRTAVTVFAVVFGATAITTLLTPKRFTSEAQLLVRCGGDNPRIVPAAGKTLFAEGLAKADRIMAGEMQLIQSDAVLERVVRSQKLETKWAETDASSQKLTTEEAVALLRSRLKVRVPPRSSVLQLRVNCAGGDEATRLAKAVVDAYLTRHVEVAQDVSAERERERFRDILDVVNLKIIQSPTPGDKLARPYIPGCLLLGGAGGLFLALTLGIVATSLAKRRVGEKPEDSPSSSAGAPA